MRNRVISKCNTTIYEIWSYLKDVIKVSIALDAWSSRSNRYSYLATTGSMLIGTITKN
jgi:hypothetical protein